MATPLRVKRGTRAQLNTAAGANQLAAGEPYLVTDEGRLAVGTGAGAFSAMEKQTDLNLAFVIDGGGATISTGVKGDLEIPFACTIIGWTLLADQTGSAVIEVSKGAYANWPTVSVITASAKPTLSSARKNTSTTLTGWTTAVAAGDVLQIGVNSAATVQRVVLTLKVRKT